MGNEMQGLKRTLASTTNKHTKTAQAPCEQVLQLQGQVDSLSADNDNMQQQLQSTPQEAQKLQQCLDDASTSSANAQQVNTQEIKRLKQQLAQLTAEKTGGRQHRLSQQEQEVAGTGDNAQAASATADAPENLADETSARVDAPNAHAAVPGTVDQPPSDESQTTDINLPPKQRAPESQSADTERLQQPSEGKAAKKKRKSKNKSARNKARQQRQAEEEEQVLGVQAKQEEKTGALQQQRQAEEEEQVPAVQAKQEEAGDLQQHEQEELGWHDAEDDTDSVIYHLTKSVPHLSVDIDWLRAVPSILDPDAPQALFTEACQDETEDIVADRAVGNVTELGNGSQNPKHAKAASQHAKQGQAAAKDKQYDHTTDQVDRGQAETRKSCPATASRLKAPPPPTPTAKASLQSRSQAAKPDAAPQPNVVDPSGFSSGANVVLGRSDSDSSDSSYSRYGRRSQGTDSDSCSEVNTGTVKATGGKVGSKNHGSNGSDGSEPATVKDAGRKVSRGQKGNSSIYNRAHLDKDTGGKVSSTQTGIDDPNCIQSTAAKADGSSISSNNTSRTGISSQDTAAAKSNNTAKRVGGGSESLAAESAGSKTSSDSDRPGTRSISGSKPITAMAKDSKISSNKTGDSDVSGSKPITAIAQDSKISNGKTGNNNGSSNEPVTAGKVAINGSNSRTVNASAGGNQSVTAGKAAVNSSNSNSRTGNSSGNHSVTAGKAAVNSSNNNCRSANNSAVRTAEAAARAACDNLSNFQTGSSSGNANAAAEPVVSKATSSQMSSGSSFANTAAKTASTKPSSSNGKTGSRNGDNNAKAAGNKPSSNSGRTGSRYAEKAVESVLNKPSSSQTGNIGGNAETAAKAIGSHLISSIGMAGSGNAQNTAQAEGNQSSSSNGRTGSSNAEKAVDIATSKPSSSQTGNSSDNMDNAAKATSKNVSSSQRGSSSSSSSSSSNGRTGTHNAENIPKAAGSKPIGLQTGSSTGHMHAEAAATLITGPPSSSNGRTGSDHAKPAAMAATNKPSSSQTGNSSGNVENTATAAGSKLSSLQIGSSTGHMHAEAAAKPAISKPSSSSGSMLIFGSFPPAIEIAQTSQNSGSSNASTKDSRPLKAADSSTNGSNASLRVAGSSNVDGSKTSSLKATNSEPGSSSQALKATNSSNFGGSKPSSLKAANSNPSSNSQPLGAAGTTTSSSGRSNADVCLPTPSATPAIKDGAEPRSTGKARLVPTGLALVAAKPNQSKTASNERLAHAELNPQASAQASFTVSPNAVADDSTRMQDLNTKSTTDQMAQSQTRSRRDVRTVQDIINNAMQELMLSHDSAEFLQDMQALLSSTGQAELLHGVLKAAAGKLGQLSWARQQAAPAWFRPRGRRQLLVYMREGLNRSYRSAGMINDAELSRDLASQQRSAHGYRVSSLSFHRDSPGYAMMQQKGWSEGQGLGANLQGKLEPFLPASQPFDEEGRTQGLGWGRYPGFLLGQQAADQLQEVIVALCSADGPVVTDGAVQQGLQAFLTSGLPAPSPGAPDLTLKALCWVATLMAELVFTDALTEDQAHSLIASAVSAQARSLPADAWQQVTAVLQDNLAALQEAARDKEAQQQQEQQTAADQLAELHQPQAPRKVKSRVQGLEGKSFKLKTVQYGKIKTPAPLNNGQVPWE